MLFQYKDNQSYTQYSAYLRIAHIGHALDRGTVFFCFVINIISPSPSLPPSLPLLIPKREVGEGGGEGREGESGSAPPHPNERCFLCAPCIMFVTMTHCVFEHRQQVVQCGWSYKSWSRSLGRPEQNDEASENSTWQSRRARMLKSSLSRYD